MNLEVEDIKALDSNKVYLVYVDCASVPAEILDFQCSRLMEAAEKYNLKFILLDKNSFEVVSPKDVDVTVSGGN